MGKLKKIILIYKSKWKLKWRFFSYVSARSSIIVLISPQVCKTIWPIVDQFFANPCGFLDCHVHISRPKQRTNINKNTRQSMTIIKSCISTRSPVTTLNTIASKGKIYATLLVQFADLFLWYWPFRLFYASVIALFWDVKQ